MELPDVELAEVEAAVGSSSFKRGRSYARGNRVAAIEWDANAERLSGSVVGQGALYDTAAFFTADSGGALDVRRGRMHLPGGLQLQARRGDRDRRDRQPWHWSARTVPAAAAPGRRRPSRGRGRGRSARSSTHRRRTRPAPRWRSSWRCTPRGSHGPRRAAADGAADATWCPRRLGQRLADWSGLDSWHVRERRISRAITWRSSRAATLSTARASDGPATTTATALTRRSISATATADSCGRCWTRRARLGLTLVHARPGLGEVHRHGGASCASTSPRDGDHGWLVDCRHPDRRRGHAMTSSRCCSSAQADTASCAPSAPTSRPATIREPAAAAGAPGPVDGAVELQRMILDRERLEIPASELYRFADEICPALRNRRRASCPRTGRSRRPRSPRRRSCCARATVPITPSRSAGSGPTGRRGHATRRIRLEWQRPRAFAISRPSARSSPTPAHRHRARTLRPARRRRTARRRAGHPAHRSRQHAPDDRGAAAPRARTDIEVEVSGQPADYRDVGDSLDDRRLDRRRRRRARLVRPRRDDQHRRSRAAVRRGVRGARERRVAHAARRRRSLLAARPRGCSRCAS